MIKKVIWTIHYLEHFSGQKYVMHWLFQKMKTKKKKTADKNFELILAIRIQILLYAYII